MQLPNISITTFNNHNRQDVKANKTKCRTWDTPFQSRSIAQYLDAINGSIEQFPVREIRIYIPFKSITKYKNNKETIISFRFVWTVENLFKPAENWPTCINCLVLSFDLASSENNVTSFIAHISPLSLMDNENEIRYRHSNKWQSLANISKEQT